MFSGLDFTPSPELGNHQSKLLKNFGRPALSLFHFYRYQSSQIVRSIIAQFKKEYKPYWASLDSSPALKSGVFSGVFIKAKNPDVTRVAYGGSIYSIYDAYPTKVGAESAAKDLRTRQGRIYIATYTNAVVVDLGKDAGRLRYGVFTAKGRKI